MAQVTANTLKYTMRRRRVRQHSQNPTSYPVRYFYNMVGYSDGTARMSHEAAVQNLTSQSQHITNQNFVYHDAPGGHDYTVASTGLYNFLRISFGK